MKTFDKSSKLDNVLYDVRGPVVDEAARMEADGLSILKLNIGNPAPFGFNAPEEVILDMRQSLWECQGYSDSKGLFSARKAIMQYCQLKKIPGVTMDDIYTGNGVSELINLSMQALLNLDLRQQRRAAAYHHVLTSTGRKPLHFRELYMGPEKAIC